MARLDKLFQFFGTLSCRNILTNRILTVNQQPVVTLKTETKNRIKVLKVPQPPKRPLPPYIRFSNLQRSQIKEKHPEWNILEVTTQCARDWKLIDDAQKQKLSNDYHQELKVYTEQVHAFKAALTTEQADAIREANNQRRVNKQRRSILKLNRETNKPKRPTSSYLYFVKEKLESNENKGKNYKDLLATYKNEWNLLPMHLKEKYIALHAIDSTRYVVEMEKWEKKMIEEGKIDLIRKSSQIVAMKSTSTRKKIPDN